jgi:hypothetical protein
MIFLIIFISFIVIIFRFDLIGLIIMMYTIMLFIVIYSINFVMSIVFMRVEEVIIVI